MFVFQVKFLNFNLKTFFANILSFRQTHPTPRRSPWRTWLGSRWSSSPAATDQRVSQAKAGMIKLFNFPFFRIYPDWILCEQWLPGPGAEGEQPLAPAVGQAAEEYPGDQSQVRISNIVCAMSDQKQTSGTKPRWTTWMSLIKLLTLIYVFTELRSSR